MMLCCGSGSGSCWLVGDICSICSCRLSIVPFSVAFSWDFSSATCSRIRFSLVAFWAALSDSLAFFMASLSFLLSSVFVCDSFSFSSSSSWTFCFRLSI